MNNNNNPNKQMFPFSNNNNNNNNNNNPNPMGNFNPMTTNGQMLQNMYKFNNAYANNQAMINKTNFSNQNNMVHNNLKQNILDEHIVEYTIHIDSADRDVRYYKDPFNYTVMFNPPSSRIYNEEQKDGTFVEHSLKGPPAPHITREFKNVQYIRLDSVLLPRYTHIYDDSGYQFDTDVNSESNIYDDRFVILRVEELDKTDNVVYGTNINTERSFGLIFPDKLISKDYYSGVPLFAQRTFKSSKLGNINKLSMKFLDSYGNPIKIQENTGANTAVSNTDPLVAPDSNGNYSVAQTDMRHPLNKKIQNHITITIGVVENQMNVNTKFSN
jgi:hypothetical protein